MKMNVLLNSWDWTAIAVFFAILIGIALMCSRKAGKDAKDFFLSGREAKFLMPMIEDAVFGGIPTDRSTMFPSPEDGFINTEVWNRRKPEHERFNAFAKAHRDMLVAPTVHSVRIFYPEREVLLSEKTISASSPLKRFFSVTAFRTDICSPPRKM